MLGQACRMIRATYSPALDVYQGPLSPAAGLLRDIMKWKEALPPHLQLGSIERGTLTCNRSILLLHIQQYHVISVLSRNALLYMAAKLNEGETDRDDADTSARDPVSMAEVCIDAGRQSCLLLLKLDSINQFNAVTAWDVYYLYSTAMVLVLTIIYDVRQWRESSVGDPTGILAEMRSLLHQCAQLANKHLQNPRVPGTMHRWATVVTEITAMADDFVRKGPLQGSTQNQNSVGKAADLQDPSIYDSDQALSSSMPKQAVFGDFQFDTDSAVLVPSNTMAGASYLVPNLGLPWHEDHWKEITGMLLGNDFTL